MSQRIRLGVNIDHVATLREVRKAPYPDIVEAARLCAKGGADQITIHLREDRRHIQDQDLIDLLRHQKLPVNLEMAVTNEMIEIAQGHPPASITLVPERRAEMTTESGLDLRSIEKKRADLKKLGRHMKIYGFIDASIDQVDLAAALELDGIEFHTGPFAHAFLKGRRSRALLKEISRLNHAARRAAQLGLEVKAGHGLTCENVSRLFQMPELSELNIGHSIVARAVIVGLKNAVAEMRNALKKPAS